MQRAYRFRLGGCYDLDRLGDKGRRGRFSLFHAEKERAAGISIYDRSRGFYELGNTGRGERSKVHNCFNGIGAWFCQAVGGILPDEDEPGYKHFFIKPQIPNGVTWARAARETPYGTARVSWTMENRSLSLDLEIPANSMATFIAPFNVSNCVLDGNNVEISAGSILLESGKHTLSLPAE